MKVCKRGHEFRGDENYRARKGWCPICLREVQARYETTEKARARRIAYEKTGKGRDRAANYYRTDKGADAKARYDQSPKGWMNALRKRRNRALERRNQRKEAEDS
jgi:hypothetical protein